MDSDAFEEEIIPEASVFKVFTTENVYDLMMMEVLKVQEVAQLPNNLIRNLLHKNKWDTEKLLEAIYEDEKLTEKSWESAPRNVRTLMDCDICYDTVKNPSKINVLECNHRFCNDCLHGYLVSQISDGGLLNCVSCPGFQCKYELDDVFVLRRLEGKLKTKYKQIIAKSFVQSNKMIKWCPGADCENAIQIMSGNLLNLMESVRCTCGNYFCFMCDYDSHDPLTCEMLARWLKDSKGELSEMQTEEWKAKNTKLCPKCKVPIEKNGGCMHMSCCSCKHQFCWLCFGDWKHHGVCPNQTEKRPAQAEISITKRYAFYREKFDFMNNVYKLDVYHYRKLMNYKQEVELYEQWIKVDFVAIAIEMLLQCRRTIMHSYVFIYFKTTVNNQIFLLETMIEDLYRFTEDLSFLVENQINAENVYKIKSDAVYKTFLCKSRRQKLLEYITEGSEQNWWRNFPIPAKDLLGEAYSEYV